jgi:hypothetical protein
MGIHTIYFGKEKHTFIASTTQEEINAAEKEYNDVPKELTDKEKLDILWREHGTI